MIHADRGAPLGRKVAFAAGAAATVVFLALRGVLLVVREPFFDEIFSVWIARKPWLDLLAALRVDSGPPLYYVLLRLLTAGEPTVFTGRLLSLVTSVGLLVAVLAWKRAGEARWIVAFLLALFPPHLYFSAEARAYALCALLAGLSAIVLDRWAETRGRGPLACGLTLALAAAYAHYYGVFFLALPLALAGLARNRRMFLDAAAGSLLAALLFVPGFLLALEQPSEAIGWMAQSSESRGLADPLLALSFAAPYPQIFVAPPPLWLQVLALALTAAILLAGIRSTPARRWAVITLVPVILVVAFGLAGRPVHFPMRFESVIALPFVVWLGFSIQSIRLPGLRAGALAGLVSIGLLSSLMVLLHVSARDPDPWRTAAVFVRSSVPSSVPVVASRYGYLEMFGQRSHAWDPRVVPFPREQGEHPGWARAALPADRAAAELDLLPATPFVWIGPAGGWEQQALEMRHRVQPLLVAGPVVVARVSEDGVDELQHEHRGDAGEKEEDDS